MQQPSPVFSPNELSLAGPDEPVTGRSIPDSSLERTIQDTLRSLKSAMGDDGVGGVVIVHRGRTIWAGPRSDEVHPIWSCTKSFLSTCLGLLWDDGKCSPEDLVGGHLPELARDYPSVTLRHLATFTSGMHAETDKLEVGPPDYPPGAAFHYSRQSDILGLALTIVAGESLASLFRRRIADPIGMDPAGWQWCMLGEREGITINGGAGHPDSGLRMSARDLARFGWLYAKGGVWNGRRLVSRRYIDYATIPHVDARTPMHNPADWYRDLPGTYGLNWWTNGIRSDGRRLWPNAPSGAFAAQGNLNNICIVVPDWQLVLVRTGQDNIGVEVESYDAPLRIFRDALSQ